MATTSNKDDGTMRSFSTGATRDTSEGKLDLEGFTHPMVMKQYAKFMNMHRIQSDGQLRDSDNWQKGIPIQAYIKSLTRHREEVWQEYRGFGTDNGLIAGLCGVIFNAMGYMLEELKKSGFKLVDFDGDEPIPEIAERKERLCNESQNEADNILVAKDFESTILVNDDDYETVAFPDGFTDRVLKDFLAMTSGPVAPLTMYGKLALECVRLGLDPEEFLIKPTPVPAESPALGIALPPTEATPIKSADGPDCTTQLCSKCSVEGCAMVPVAEAKVEQVENAVNDDDYKEITFPDGFKARMLKSFTENKEDAVYTGDRADPFKEPHDHSDPNICSCDSCTPNKGMYGEHYFGGGDKPAAPPVGFSAHSKACPRTSDPEIVQPVASEEVVSEPFPEKLVDGAFNECKGCRHIGETSYPYYCNKCGHFSLGSEVSHREIEDEHDYGQVCSDCKHTDVDYVLEPCSLCNHINTGAEFENNFEESVKHRCDTCINKHVRSEEPPCCTCSVNNNVSNLSASFWRERE